MSSTITVPTRDAIAAYPPAQAVALIAVATAAKADINALGSIAPTTWTTIKTSTFTCVPHTIVKVNPTGGAFALTLPTAVGLTADDTVAVLNVSTSVNAVTVGTTAAQTITGNGGIAASTYVMNQAGLSVVFIPDGTAWFVFPGA